MAFAGKNFVVTGAASGIGRATVEAASAAGAHVVMLDVDDAAAAQVADATGATWRHCDVSSPEHWADIATQLAGAATPDYLFLNAGIQIAPPDAPLQEYTFEAMQLSRYRRMMGVNVDGVVFGLQAMLPLMGPGAAIVVTSSLAGITPYSVDPLYAMSKHAVSGLVRSLGPTLAERGITINAICPGGIDTAIIPQQQRTDDAVFMTPANVAAEVLTLMTAAETGKTWAKVAETKPAFIIRAPGDKSG